MKSICIKLSNIHVHGYIPYNTANAHKDSGCDSCRLRNCWLQYLLGKWRLSVLLNTGWVSRTYPMPKAKLHSTVWRMTTISAAKEWWLWRCSGENSNLFHLTFLTLFFILPWMFLRLGFNRGIDFHVCHIRALVFAGCRSWSLQGSRHNHVTGSQVTTSDWTCPGDTSKSILH